MQTIAFYSYKGGVGRSLLVANTAKYLSALHKDVFTLDLDLEAPGLHYKFALGTPGKLFEDSIGLVEVLYYFQQTAKIPDSLASYSGSVEVQSGGGRIRMMRAGAAPHRDYWRKLSHINWYDLFYGETATGVQF